MRKIDERQADALVDVDDEHDERWSKPRQNSLFAVNRSQCPVFNHMRLSP